MKRLVILAAALAASAGAAQPPANPPAANGATNQYNPNETVCRRMTIPGSRLASGRMCKTRAEWELQRMTDRMDTERIQQRRIVPR